MPADYYCRISRGSRAVNVGCLYPESRNTPIHIQQSHFKCHDLRQYVVAREYPEARHGRLQPEPVRLQGLPQRQGLRCKRWQLFLMEGAYVLTLRVHRRRYHGRHGCHQCCNSGRLSLRTGLRLFHRHSGVDLLSLRNVQHFGADRRHVLLAARRESHGSPRHQGYVKLYGNRTDRCRSVRSRRSQLVHESEQLLPSG